ncbi:MAG: thioredoxin domain-containing protein, partial [Ignavibacteriaceae bacterium]
MPVLVDFWAEWCGPCKVLGPVLERLAEIHKEQWKLAKLDTDKNQEIAAEYGIREISNVKLFINGEVVNEFAGALP